MWFSELVYFYDELLKKHISFDIASPKGGSLPIDPRSLESNDEVVQKYRSDTEFMHQLGASLRLDQIDASEYFIAYLVGGHGAMWDFPDNVSLQNIIEEVYSNQGTITAVGHGVSGLLNVRLTDGTFFVRDRYITGFSNMEETLVRFVSEFPFFLEDELLARGANFTKAMLPFTEHIELDERLITGQNPNSARKVARKLVEELWEK
jgi:putative intracellular protease/amidase